MFILKRIYLNLMLNYYMDKFYKLCDLNSLYIDFELDTSELDEQIIYVNDKIELLLYKLNGK
jgi:hypothetical protein